MSELFRRFRRLVESKRANRIAVGVYVAGFCSLVVWVVYAPLKAAPNFEGPQICPLPSSAREILELRLNVGGAATGGIGALAAIAHKSGHGEIISNWAQKKWMSTGQRFIPGGSTAYGVVDISRIMEWSEAGAHATVFEMQSKLTVIDGVGKHPLIGNQPHLPQSVYAAMARESILRNIMVPAVIIQGRWPELMGAISADKLTYDRRSQWQLRYLIESGRSDLLVSLFEALEPASRQYSVIPRVLRESGHYELASRLDAMIPKSSHQIRGEPALDSLYDAMRRNDFEAVEAYFTTLREEQEEEVGEKSMAHAKRNRYNYAIGLLPLYYARHGDWRRAEALMSLRKDSVTVWLSAADIARRAGEEGLAKAWKREAVDAFCRSRPNRGGGKNRWSHNDGWFVLRTLEALYSYTVLEEASHPTGLTCPRLFGPRIT